jgi:hypothetical protein
VLALLVVGMWWAFATGRDLVYLFMAISCSLSLLADAASSPRIRRFVNRLARTS